MNRDRYDPLATCPPDLRSNWEVMASKAKLGHRVPIMRLKCLECMAWQPGEVRRCEVTSCALWIEREKFLAVSTRRAEQVKAKRGDAA